MSGPWDNYAPKQTAQAGPWAKYATAKQSSAPPAQPAPQQPASRPFFEAPSSLADAIGPLESVGNVASGTIGQILGGIAGVGAIPVNLARGQSLSNAVANAGDVTTGVENALTYQPRTAVGHDITNVVQYPFRKLGDLADTAGSKVSDVTGSPALGTVANTLINGIPLILGARGDFKAPVASDFSARVPEPVAAAREAGFKLTPTQAQAPGGVLGRIAESLSSHAKLERSLSRKNAEQVNAKAGSAVGVNGPVTAESLNAAKAPHNSVYDEVGATGTIPTDAKFKADLAKVQAPGSASFPDATPTAIDSLRESHNVPEFDAKDAIARVRSLRRDASQNIGAKFDPEKNALGYAQRSIADALENQIERHLQNTAGADSTLMDRFQTARQSLAKIHSVADALKAGKGQSVSAKNLAKQLERGRPLSGDLRTIAESAQQFPRSFQDIAAIRNSGPIDVLPTTIGLGATFAHPAAWPYALATALGPSALRKVLGSEAYQRAAFDPRVPQTYARPGVKKLAGIAAILGQDEQKTPILQLLERQPVAVNQ